MAKEEVCPRDEIADPPGMAVLPIYMFGFDEGLVSFRTLCGVQSSLVRFAPNRAIAWGPPQPHASLTEPFFPIGIEHLIYMIFCCYGSSIGY